MARGPLIAFVAVLLVGALSAGGYLLKKREAIASTPSAYTGLNIPLPLDPGSEACADEVAFDAHSEIVRFGATAARGTRAAPPIEVTARGYDKGEFRNHYRSSDRVTGGWQGTRTLDVPLTPPRSTAFGFLCVRNLGDQPIDLVGSQDGRAYSRPTVRIDGKETSTELEFRLLERGRHSLVSRVGETTRHAATLKPFGAWWWWVLALLLVAVPAAAVFGALRTALACDAARGLDGGVARAAPSLDRARRLVERVPGWAIVAGACALVFVWLAYWSLSTHVFQADEDQYVYLSRWLQTDLPSSLWNFDVYGRGLQRLEVWLLAIPSALADSPWSLRGGRTLNTLAFVSTSIPVYLLGRRLELRPRWAALPAAVSVAVPWAVVTTGFLTENVAYPACLWAIWAIWRTAATPSGRADLLSLVLVVVAGMARSGLLLLAPVLPLVAAVTSLRWTAGTARDRLRSAAREHLVLWVAVALGVLVLALGALGVAGGLSDRLAGGYQTQLGFGFGAMLEKMGGYLSKVVVGTAFLPAAVGLPWIAVELARPRDRGTFAFSLLAVVATLALLYSLNSAGPDERYVLYLAPLVLLPATLALARREVSALGLGVASILLALLLLRVPWNPEQGPFGYFVSPVEMFYTRTVGTRLDRYLPGGATLARDIAALALGAAGVALAFAHGRVRAQLTPGRVGLLVAAVVLVIPLQTEYVLSKYVNGAGAKSGPSDRTRAFADTLVPAGKPVGEFIEGAGRESWFAPVWQEVQFYNQRIDSVYSLGPNVNAVPPGDALFNNLSFDPRTGRLSVPLPDYVVIPMTVGQARLRGELLYAASYTPVGLLRVAQPATLAWSAKGFDSTSQVPDGGTAEVRFYGTGPSPGPRCATYTLLAPEDRMTTWRIRVPGQPARHGTVLAAHVARVNVPLSRLAERGFLDVRLSGEAIRVADLSVGPSCQP